MLKLTTRKKLLCIFWLIATTATMAEEGENGFGCKYDGNQQEMNACAVRDFREADKMLNKKYKAVMASLEPTKQRTLRQEQRSWLKTRDPQCKLKAKSSEGGSIWPIEYFGCLKMFTELRTKELEQFQLNR
jgi:uncharacterized protein YecT (DUF1311 family)